MLYMDNRHAYCIMAHEHPEALARLVRLIDDPRNDIFIHIDRRASIRPFKEAISAAVRHSGIYFLPQRRKITWGGFSQVNTTLDLFQTALEKSDYRRLHLLSAADLPLKTQDQIHHYCDELFPDDEFIGYLPDEEEISDIHKKTTYRHFLIRYARRTKRRHIGQWLGHMAYNAIYSCQKQLGLKRTMPDGICKGDNWVSLTSDCCRYILAKREWIERTFNHVLCADEMFVQTIIKKSPFYARIHPAGNMREIDWTRGNPYIWRYSDRRHLLESPALFARKFSENIDSDIIAAIERHLTGA